MSRLADVELSNELSNKFFENAAFFKKELDNSNKTTNSNQATIPKDEVETLDIRTGDRVHAVFMGLDNGQVLLDKSRSVRAKGSSLYITIPRDFFEELDRNNQFTQIALTKSIDPESLVPSGGMEFVERIMSIGGINFFETTMLYKGQIFTRREESVFTLSLPRRESKYMSLSHEQPMNVSIIELDSGERITIKDRSKFRVNVMNVKKASSDNDSFRFTIPVKRARMRGYKDGQLVQVIARPARLDV